MKEVLSVNQMSVCFSEKKVVQDISFSLGTGEILGIVGESGSGKSTIIKAIMGLLKNSGTVTEGEINFQGQNLLTLSKSEQRNIAGARIGMIFQDCKSALCPIRTIERQMYESMSAHRKITKADAKSQMKMFMEKIGLSDTERILKSYPFELSGGMNQRIGICMAMLEKPVLLLADEPTSALDVTVQKQVVDEMLFFQKEYQTSMIVVTHNIGVVRAMADQVMVLKDGCMVEYGKTKEVLSNPKSPYTKSLLEAVPKLDNGVENE